MISIGNRSTEGEHSMATQASEPAGSVSPLDRHTAPAETSRGRGKAVASLVLGIIGVLAAIAIAILGLIIGIIGTVLAFRAGDDGYTPWQATAGKVLGILAIVVAVVNGIVGAIIASS
jgi:hypothetical protein